MLPTVSGTTPPLTLANPPTEMARRDTQNRERIGQLEQGQGSGRSRNLSAEGDPEKAPAQRVEGEPVEAGETAEVEAIDADGSSKEKQTAEQGQDDGDDEQLSERDREKIRELKARDLEVRAHEAAHAAAGGRYAGAPSYEYERGPDGASYAVGGEVPIDVSPISGDPQATIAKMQTVYRAALAPAEPSPQDRKVASEAMSQEASARAELAKQNMAGNAQPTAEDNSTGDDGAGAPPADSEPAARGAIAPAGARTLESSQEMTGASAVPDGRAIRIELYYLNRVVPAGRPQFSATA
ncbi:MAG: catalase [Gammaproteobacteria bacterium]|nr:catalase [Gammaproteobacteria bacterium]